MANILARMLVQLSTFECMAGDVRKDLHPVNDQPVWPTYPSAVSIGANALFMLAAAGLVATHPGSAKTTKNNLRTAQTSE